MGRQGYLQGVACVREQIGFVKDVLGWVGRLFEVKGFWVLALGQIRPFLSIVMNINSNSSLGPCIYIYIYFS